MMVMSGSCRCRRRHRETGCGLISLTGGYAGHVEHNNQLTRSIHVSLLKRRRRHGIGKDCCCWRWSEKPQIEIIINIHDQRPRTVQVTRMTEHAYYFSHALEYLYLTRHIVDGLERERERGKEEWPE